MPRRSVVKAGDRLAPFTLVDVTGGELGMDTLVADGPAVLVFFRSPAARPATSLSPTTNVTCNRRCRPAACRWWPLARSCPNA
ncbi:hypothetical protein [Pseudomonas sp. RIT-To-2]|uniref:hypothetical protein n=1 Tax=Pseudomonas sp. RIT-To-2 TaxID=3462541 RepID=UPI002413ABD9